MNKTPREMSFADGLLEARHLLSRRQLSDAEKRLRTLAAQKPEHAEVLGLRAMLAAERGKPANAFKLLTRSLASHAAPTVFRRNLNGLLTLAMAHRRLALAQPYAKAAMPTSDFGSVLGSDDLRVVVSLANQLSIFREFEKAIALLSGFWAQLSQDPWALELMGALKLEVGRPDDALEALKKARRLTTPKPGLLIALSAAAAAAGDAEASRKTMEEFVNAFPAYLSEQSSSQLMTIGIANWRTAGMSEFTSVANVHFSGNFISQIASRTDSYRVLSLLLNSNNALKAIARNPVPDLIYNSVVNPEAILINSYLEKLSILISVWDRPIINHPEKVLRSTRLHAGNLYSDIESLVVPKIEIFRKDRDPADLIGAIEGKFQYPVIARGLVEQEGKNTFLVHNRAELGTAIGNVETELQFYVIQFVESRHEDGYFRKIRAAIAGDAIHIVRVDYDSNWNVHGRKAPTRADFYRERRRLLEEEAAICWDPDATLGPQVMPTLRAIRLRNPLDVFGIDFDVKADGKLLFFEANASMNLLSNAPPDIDYPKEPEVAFMAAFNDFALRLRSTSTAPAGV